MAIDQLPDGFRMHLQKFGCLGANCYADKDEMTLIVDPTKSRTSNAHRIHRWKKIVDTTMKTEKGAKWRR